MKNRLNVLSQNGKLTILSKNETNHLKGGNVPTDPTIVNPLDVADGVVIEDLNQI